MAFFNEMEISTGLSAHEWTRAVDELRITTANQKVAHATEEGRIQRRQEQKDAVDVLDESISLYIFEVGVLYNSKFTRPILLKFSTLFLNMNFHVTRDRFFLFNTFFPCNELC